MNENTGGERGALSPFFTKMTKGIDFCDLWC